MMDRILNQNTQIKNIKHNYLLTNQKLDEFRELCFNKEGKVEIFDKIDRKIESYHQQVEALSMKFDQVNEGLTNRFEHLQKSSELSTTTFETLRTHTFKLIDEQVVLHDNFRKHNERFVSETARIDKAINAMKSDYDRKLDSLFNTTKGHAFTLELH